MRLNRFLALAGIASRRKCDELIAKGLVSVNGEIVKEMGIVIDENKDKVTFKGHPVNLKKKYVYILLNKPLGVVSTARDNFKRQTVVDLVAAVPERVYPVGRLDYNTTGVLILTDDGELTNRLLHPRYKIEKKYNILLDKKIKPIDIYHIERGIELDGKATQPCKLREVRVIDNQSFLEIEMREGRNRQIRRIFEKLNYDVLELDRTYFGGLTYSGLKTGEWRYLKDFEIDKLRRKVEFSGE